ncbi:MAG: GGDEF domain-containing protein, partial [Burkholderiaceae bacterium]|nr:GGDEF domain-containing protein [Burkholderiaceae bacterium]
MSTVEPLHVETLLKVFQLVATLLALVTLGGAWQLRGERGMWLWSGAFAASALTQLARPLLLTFGAPPALLSIGHVGGVVAALFVLLGLRAYLGQPARWRWPLACAVLLALASFTATAATGQLAMSLVLTQAGTALLLIAPAALAAWRAWRARGGFAMGLMMSDLIASVVADLGRSLSVSPWLVVDRAQATQNNAYWLLIAITLMIVQAFALVLLIHDHALRQIRRLIEVDVLTGLLNRRGFDERIRRVLQRGAAHAPVLALLDVDHFKRINDNFGHAVGDAVLSGIGERLRETLRPVDLAVRLCGEEFAVVWPQAEADAEQRLGERLR